MSQAAAVVEGEMAAPMAAAAAVEVRPLTASARAAAAEMVALASVSWSHSFRRLDRTGESPMSEGLLLEVEVVQESHLGWLVRIHLVNGVVSHIEARGTSPEDAFARALAALELEK